MNKYFPLSFFVLAGVLLSVKLIAILTNHYHLLAYQSSIKEVLYFIILRGYLGEIILILLAFIALFKRTPTTYLFFMIFPFYSWTGFFVAQSYRIWLGMLIFAVIIPILFNMNSIRKLYITDNHILIQNLCWAAGIGIAVGLSPLLRYLILN